MCVNSVYCTKICAFYLLKMKNNLKIRIFGDICCGNAILEPLYTGKTENFMTGIVL